ncbi:MAG: hypothetical protein K2G64_04250 [Muribaculaceae bacterium]|nr:hypothetical protein [Muribaculaceae bacterium]MDE5968299.1 hypothetical protein [Muribaculaceae bacterium]MDE7394024.1 hypothetical protein [Muribaculaceae bacterium]
MKKIVIAALLCIVAFSAKATALFPFFVDIAPNYEEVVTPEFEAIGLTNALCYSTTTSYYPQTFEQLESFYKDVLPDDVLREEDEINGTKIVIYSCIQNFNDDTIRTSSKLYAIMVIPMPDGSFRAAYIEGEVEE